MPQMNDEYWDLVDRLVPDHGEADTVQGELVRAVLRLTAEYSREGCGNWDGYFEDLMDFAWEKLNDGSLDVSERAAVASVFERLRRYGRAAAADEEYASCTADEAALDEMDDLLERVAARWCALHPEPIPFKPDAHGKGTQHGSEP